MLDQRQHFMAFPEVIHQSRYTVQIQETFLCGATFFQIFNKKELLIQLDRNWIVTKGMTAKAKWQSQEVTMKRLSGTDSPRYTTI